MAIGDRQVNIRSLTLQPQVAAILEDWRGKTIGIPWDDFLAGLSVGERQALQSIKGKLINFIKARVDFLTDAAEV